MRQSRSNNGGAGGGSRDGLCAECLRHRGARNEHAERRRFNLDKARKAAGLTEMTRVAYRILLDEGRWDEVAPDVWNGDVEVRLFVLVHKGERRSPYRGHTGRVRPSAGSVLEHYRRA